MSEPGTTEGVKNKRYFLVGECYVQGLMQGEAMEALEYKTNLIGPVPSDIVMQQIVSDANEREPFSENDFNTISEMNRLRHKKAKQDAGWLANTDDLKVAVRVRAEKRWFDIK
jgi:hypothetical protein